jgi:hypothetical protein
MKVITKARKDSVYVGVPLGSDSSVTKSAHTNKSNQSVSKKSAFIKNDVEYVHDDVTYGSKHNVAVIISPLIVFTLGVILAAVEVVFLQALNVMTLPVWGLALLAASGLILLSCVALWSVFKVHFISYAAGATCVNDQAPGTSFVLGFLIGHIFISIVLANTYPDLVSMFGLNEINSLVREHVNGCSIAIYLSAAIQSIFAPSNKVNLIVFVTMMLLSMCFAITQGLYARGFYISKSTTINMNQNFSKVKNDDIFAYAPIV